MGLRIQACLGWLARLARRFKRDEGGQVLVYVTIASAAILGMVGLALDGSRAMITHSEASAAADAAALAAASQLNGAPDALVRAANAAQTTPLVSNSQTFAQGEGDGGATVTITGIRFLRDLPPLDSTPIGSSYETTDPAEARFVEVTTEQLTHTNTFLRAVTDSPGVNIRGVAVAGFRQYYCKIPPLMICNPDEVNPGDPFNPRIGSEIIAKTQGDSSQWAPGTFGLLDLPNCGNSAACMREQLAAVSPNVCVEHSIDVRPGEAAGPAHAGMNTRFDIYTQGLSKSAANAPDTNITQDFQSCSQDTVAGGAPFPHDTDNPAPTRVGNGLWDCESYWLANHSQAKPSWCTSATGAPYTRYYVYQLERTSGNASNFGAPRCVTPGVDERRVIYLTVLNCKQYGVSANSQNVPVEALVKTFLLRPVSQNGSDAEMDLEIQEVVTPGANSGVMLDDVQLYR